MIRICLIVAIIAGLAVAVVNFVQVKEVITTTRTTLNTTSNSLVTAQNDLRKTKKELDGTKAQLTATQNTLKTTEDERNAAQAEAESNKKLAAGLQEKLTKTTSERDLAQADLAAWKVLGISVDQVKGIISDLKDSKRDMEVQRAENKILANKNRSLAAQLEALIGKDPRIPLPETLKATVVAVDPKWEFIVLDAGESQGAIPNGEMLISRNGKLVAKVRITAVQGTRSIANIVTGWKLGDIVEGDSAIPAFTGS
ncbi:MAG: hypothetical protein RLY20_1563 [Verrucomicrobiota bacterium]|jgi:cell shape-determining protein MreC